MIAAVIFGLLLLVSVCVADMICDDGRTRP